ncbi:MAG: hypothetical protein RIF32_05450 [Leptospirales bacterium]|jgi:hypothetical protein
MAQAQKSEASRDNRNVVRERSLKELSYALVATGITFVLAVLFYMYVPILREQMRDQDESLKHTRVFTAEPNGGTIRYEFTLIEGGEEHDQAIDHYIADLEILGRRFERGEFSMVKLPGMTDSPEYAAMRRNTEAFEYQVVKDSEGPSLVIRTNNPAARAALHDYLKYLETRWVF